MLENGPEAVPCAAAGGPTRGSILHAPCHGGDHGQGITVLDGRLCSTSKADILILERQVDARPERPLALAYLCPYAGTMPLAVVEDLVHGDALAQHAALMLRTLLQGQRRLDQHCHPASPSSSMRLKRIVVPSLGCRGISHGLVPDRVPPLVNRKAGQAGTEEE